MLYTTNKVTYIMHVGASKIHVLLELFAESHTVEYQVGMQPHPECSVDYYLCCSSRRTEKCQNFHFQLVVFLAYLLVDSSNVDSLSCASTFTPIAVSTKTNQMICKSFNAVFYIICDCKAQH